MVPVDTLHLPMLLPQQMVDLEAEQWNIAELTEVSEPELHLRVIMVEMLQEVLMLLPAVAAQVVLVVL
jgi:hypothetical protein